MNKHAKSISQARLDEKEVQYHAQFGEHRPTCAWINADPSDPELSTPQECPHRWRIKPEGIRGSYRVYWSLNAKRPRLFVSEDYCMAEHDFEKSEWWGGWLSPRGTYLVEVEE